MRGKLILKLLFVPLLVLGVLSFAPSAQAYEPDEDYDSVPTVVEDSSTPNSGDNNYDGASDSEQNTVATITNPNDTASPNAFVTLQVGDTYQVESPEFNYTYADSAWKIDEFKAVDVATLPTQPEGKVFPLGMFDIKLSCQNQDGREDSISIDNGYGCVEYNKVHTEEGCEWVASPIPADLKLIFDRVMDTSNWTMEKYDPLTDSYIDYSPYVTISTQNIGYLRTVLEWSIIDGGLGDSDGTVNGSISDPIGPSVPVATPAVSTTPATIVASTVSPATLQHTGNNLAIYSIILGFLMIGLGAVVVRKS